MKKLLIGILLVSCLNAEQNKTIQVQKENKSAFEEVKETGSLFWNSITKLTSEKVDEASSYTKKKYKEIKKVSVEKINELAGKKIIDDVVEKKEDNKSKVHFIKVEEMKGGL